ncbi:MAG: CDP-glycerol glycerophosphotransferase family protein [Micrococcales bacterium]|nr:CDP-glycerol glycerophosphotransferase family protein [Micrococcales bacterium]
MGLVADLGAARRVITNLVRARSARREVARRSGEFARPVPNTVEVAVYFADTRVNLYQIRQWYGPLRRLAGEHPVALVCRSPRTALTVNDESGLPTLYLRSIVELERFVVEQRPKIVLYVNQNTKNFQMFRYGRMWHVFINHGESDKMYMTTNQFKAYDYALVAGQAARDRLGRRLWDYDVAHRTLEIGRPQADHFAGDLPYPEDDRLVVLYAPTWEGDRPAAAYGSAATHGEALVAAVLASPRHRLVYRPHPRSGVVDPEFGAANARIIASIAAANRSDPAAHHVYDDGPELGWQLAAADIAVADISAMVYDRLATGKPLLVTRPAAAEADIDESGFLGAADWLTVADAGRVLERADSLLEDPAARESLAYWSHHHFGDTTPGAATQRFHAAIGFLIDEWERMARLHPDDEALPVEDGSREEDGDPDGLPDDA